MQGKLITVVSVISLFLAGCSSLVKKVMPMANGINQVVIFETTREESREKALKAARLYCEQTKQTPLVISIKDRYVGSMDEKTRNIVRGVSKGALFGGALFPNEAGQAVQAAGLGGVAATNSPDYETTLEFKCQ